jgi:hypothetical protein
LQCGGFHVYPGALYRLIRRGEQHLSQRALAGGD